MTVERTLARAEEDVATGRLALARQRLRGLVGSRPTNLELRERLAALYRAEGDLIQAGRWSYLAERRDPREVAAFERAYPDLLRRMVALSWRGREDEATTEVARRRLREVRERAEKTAKREVSWTDPIPSTGPDRASLWDVVLTTAIVAGAILVVAGVISLAIEGVRFLASWF